MPMLEWGRDAHQVTRNNGRQDPELAALRARGHSLLAANWRVRVRGDRRLPTRPLGVRSPPPSFNGDHETADGEARKATNGTAPRLKLPSENGSADDAETGVLVFPQIVLPTPEKPVRGPLSWAYWSARRK